MRFNSKRNKKPASETFIVASGDQAVVNSGALVDPASTALNILSGQLGVIVAGHDNGPTAATLGYGDFLTGATDETVAAVPVIQFVQGTPNSADIRNVHPINAITDKEVVKSQKVDGRSFVSITRKAYTAPTNNVWDLLGSSVTVQDSADYGLGLQFVSVRNDKWYGAHGEDNLTINYTTPDYTTLGTTSPLDHLLKNLAYQVNLNSAALRFSNPSTRRGNKQVVAVAIDEAGGGGTALSALVAGTPETILVDSSGNNVDWTPTAADIASLTNLYANTSVAATSTVEVIDLSTAGAAANADHLVFFAVDHTQAIARDDIPQVKVRLRTGLEYLSFDAATPPTWTEAERPFEGHGLGRQVRLWYESRAALNIWTQQNRHDGPQEYITPPSYLVANENYDIYIIEHNKSYYVPASHEEDTFHRTILAIPTGDSTTIAALDNVIDMWLDSVYVEGRLEKAIDVTPSTTIGNGAYIT